MRDEIHDALDGRAYDFGPQKSLANALRDAAQNIEVGIALHRPVF